MSQDQPSTPPNLIKRLTINVLRSLIRFLEGTVEKLETEPVVLPFPTRKRKSLLSRLLFPIRRLLPTALKRLSDITLLGFIAAFVLLIFSVKMFLFPTNSPPEIAELPPIVEPTPSPVVIPEPEPEPLEPIAEVEPLPPVESTEPEQPEEPQPEIIPDILTTEPPEPVEFVPSALTPEQYLVSSIQNKMIDLTTPLGIGFVESIHVNFLGGLLRINLGNQWYNLPENEQNQIANQLFKQAQELDFTHLELLNSQNHLIARSALIGSDMIILERILETEDEGS